MNDTVVFDGNCELLITGTASPVIDIVADGEFGTITEIHTIPKNYGLITWNGSVLTVS